MRKFFKLGRTKQSSHREASTEEYLSHIPHTSGAVGWGTVDHAEPGSWEEYRQGFRQNAEGFLNAARPDMYNGGYLDGEIDSYERLAITEARHCREGNIRSIHNIRIYQKAGLLELELAIAQLEEELTRCEEEVNKC